MSKVLLANPPFKKGVRSVRWPYSLKNKNLYFLYPPWFLMYSAALMEEKNIDVNLVDAVAKDMGNKQFINLVKKESPNLLLVQSETLTIDNDLDLLKKIKETVDKSQ